MSHMVSFRSTGGSKASVFIEKGCVGEVPRELIKGPILCAAVGCGVECFPIDRGAMVGIWHKHNCTVVSSLHVDKAHGWLLGRLPTLRVRKKSECFKCHKAPPCVQTTWRYAVHLSPASMCVDIKHLKLRIMVHFSQRTSCVSLEKTYAKRFPKSIFRVMSVSSCDMLPEIERYQGGKIVTQKLCGACNRRFGRGNNDVAFVFTKCCPVCNMEYSIREHSTVKPYYPKRGCVVWQFPDLGQVHVIYSSGRQQPVDWGTQFKDRLVCTWRVHGRSSIPVLETGKLPSKTCPSCTIEEAKQHDKSATTLPDPQEDYDELDIMDHIENSGQCFVCELVLPTHVLKTFVELPSSRLFDSVSKFYSSFAVCTRCLTACDRCGDSALKEPDESLCNGCYFLEYCDPVLPKKSRPKMDIQVYKVLK